MNKEVCDNSTVVDNRFNDEFPPTIIPDSNVQERLQVVSPDKGIVILHYSIICSLLPWDLMVQFGAYCNCYSRQLESCNVYIIYIYIYIYIP